MCATKAMYGTKNEVETVNFIEKLKNALGLSVHLARIADPITVSESLVQQCCNSMEVKDGTSPAVSSYMNYTD